jgi:hypothetical protein
MCRRIKTLREPDTADVTAFQEVAAAVTHATAHLLGHLAVRGPAPAARRAATASQPAGRRYLAISVTRDSRTTVTRIWPG